MPQQKIFSHYKGVIAWCIQCMFLRGLRGAGLLHACLKQGQLSAWGTGFSPIAFSVFISAVLGLFNLALG